MSSATMTAATKRANRGGDRTCTKNARLVPATIEIANVFRHLFERKAWAAVGELLGLQERSAKYRLAGEREFTVDELRTLLRSEVGIHFLARLMGEARPRWWQGFLANVAAGDARRAIRKHQRELQEAINAVESLDGTLARAEAALSVSDEDFMRPHVDALRTVARAPHRTLAR